MKTIIRPRLLVLACLLLPLCLLTGCQHAPYRVSQVQSWITPPPPPDFRVQYHRFDTRPKPMDIERLATFAEEAALDGTVHFEVVGHAYDRKQSGHNFQTGKRRAEFVRDALIEAGVPADRVNARSVGDTRPAIPYADFGKRRKHNRVEVFRSVLVETAADS